jgi:hypothetical protein
LHKHMEKSKSFHFIILPHEISLIVLLFKKSLFRPELEIVRPVPN